MHRTFCEQRKEVFLQRERHIAVSTVSSLTDAVITRLYKLHSSRQRNYVWWCSGSDGSQDISKYRNLLLPLCSPLLTGKQHIDIYNRSTNNTGNYLDISIEIPSDTSTGAFRCSIGWKLVNLKCTFFISWSPSPFEVKLNFKLTVEHWWSILLFPTF